jgi:ribosome-associated toxin RatA of RatAB toxin-antitoxin module
MRRLGQWVWRGCSCGVLLLALPGFASGASPRVLKTGPDVSVDFNVVANAPAKTCYAVLADFAHLASFVPSLDSSEILSKPGEPLRIRQVGHARAGFRTYKLDVTLAVQLDPPRQIRFERIDGNLRHMRGRWSIAGADQTCNIRYVADIEPDFWIPPLVGPYLIRGHVQKQIDALLTEIARRRAHP